MPAQIPTRDLTEAVTPALTKSQALGCIHISIRYLTEAVIPAMTKSQAPGSVQISTQDLKDVGYCSTTW